MTDNVVVLGPRRPKTYPRRLFFCSACQCSSFKVWQDPDDRESCTYVECANCEQPIDTDDLFPPR